MARTTILPWRLALGILGGSAFLVFSGLVRPDWTRAAELDDPARLPADLPERLPGGDPAAVPPGHEIGPPQERLHTAGAPLGRIEGLHFTVEILGGGREPLYLLRDAETDEPLAGPMTAETFADRYPELAPEAFRATGPDAVMRHVERDSDLR